MAVNSSSLALAKTFRTLAKASSNCAAAIVPPTNAAPIPATAAAEDAKAAAGTEEASLVIAAPVPLAIC